MDRRIPPASQARLVLFFGSFWLAFISHLQWSSLANLVKKLMTKEVKHEQL